MSELFSAIQQVISSRRNIKPQQMNGRKILDDDMNSLMLLADFAPTHGLTEPWRFVVYSGISVETFCGQHAELYKVHTANDRFENSKYEKLLHMGDKASHVIIAIMQRGALPKIPAWEEKAATACAVQNILLGATALGIASYWGSGGMAQHKAMKDFLKLNEDDFVMGILYFGYADQQPKYSRTVPLNEKVKWNY